MFLQRIHKYKYFICLFFLLVICQTAEIGLAAPSWKQPPSCPRTLPDGQLNVFYTYTFQTGGMDAKTEVWSISSGSPPGLSLAGSQQNGVLSGTPTAPGIYTFTVTATDKNGSISCVCTLTILGCSFVGGISNGIISFGNIDPSSMAIIYGNVSQQVALTCSPGMAYTVTVTPASGWTLTSGSNTIPYTLGIASSGSYSGTPVNLLIAPPSPSASAIAPANFQNSPAGTYTNASAISIAVAYTGGTITASILSSNVSGTVIPICTVSQSPGTLTFLMNPSVTGTTSGAISPDMQIKCTKNDNFSITAASTCGGLAQTYPPTCGGQIIPYTFGFSPGYSSGQGFGVAIPMNISGSVNSTNYQNAPIGDYGDLQTLTITY